MINRNNYYKFIKNAKNNKYVINKTINFKPSQVGVWSNDSLDSHVIVADPDVIVFPVLQVTV